jgi:tetratricopeptide (TPR) repeat protein
MSDIDINPRQNETLEKAEKFFGRKNYRLAKLEFEKYLGSSADSGILGKIAICEQELKRERADDLLKQARHAVKMEKNGKALECFKEAYALFPEEWVKKRIDALQGVREKSNNLAEAEAAEKSGDFRKAAELYKTVLETGKNTDNAIRTMFCFILCDAAAKAESVIENYREQLQTVDGFSRKQLYDYGYVLTRLDRYGECLAVWKKIASGNAKFLEQKDCVSYLWEKKLYEKFRLALDFPSLKKEAEEFLQYGDSQTVRGIIAYCEIKTAGQLAEKGLYESAIEMLPGLFPEMTMEHIVFYAKLYYQAMSAKQDVPMTICHALILTVAANPSFTSGFLSKEGGTKLLVDKYYDELKKRNGDNYAYTLHLDKNREALAMLDRILPDEKKETLILAPRLALLTNRNGEIFKHLAEALEKREFDENERIACMEAASSYGKYATQAMEIFEGEYNLPDMKMPADEKDRLAAFAFGLIHLDAACIALKDNDLRHASRNLMNTGRFLIDYPNYVKIFTICIDKDNAVKTEVFLTVENALSAINRKYRDKSLEEAVSRITVSRVLQQYYESEIKLKLIVPDLKKALTHLPPDYMTEEIDKLLMDAEREELREYLERMKLNQAAKFTETSEYGEVSDLFFEAMTTMYHEALYISSDDESALRKHALSELLKACVIVDPGHEVTEMIRDNYGSI